MKCAAIGCKRKVRVTPFDEPPKNAPAQHHLCYKHGWWYAYTHQATYAHTCATVFPLWSAGDIAVWLEWWGF